MLQTCFFKGVIDNIDSALDLSFLIGILDPQHKITAQ